MLGFNGKEDSWFGNKQFHLNLLSAFTALENLDPIYLVFLIFFLENLNHHFCVWTYTSCLCEQGASAAPGGIYDVCAGGCTRVCVSAFMLCSSWHFAQEIHA